ncbi:MAG TPA: isocitrate lyase/phosphoenolpyruvate mutase family protein [Kofleriaceae bacterium]|nr:isocitrate lyase/phosphoenolpyruvate mutase family protein [Kofleriaceae bacterium]
MTGDKTVSFGLGVHNPLTARLAERVGFDVLWLGSLELATSLGLPDINLLSLTEVAGIVRSVRAVTALPIYVDADNGYGSHATAVRAATEFEAAGATAICVEDNRFPKRNSLLADHRSRELEDIDDFAERIRRMAAARRRIQIIARTEAVVAGQGVAEAVKRLRRYADAGADALFVQANHRFADQLLPVVAEIAGLRPIVLAPTALPDLTAADLERFAPVTLLFANVVVRGIVGALPPLLRRLREGGSLASVLGELESLEGLFELTDTRAWVETATGGK